MNLSSHFLFLNSHQYEYWPSTPASSGSCCCKRQRLTANTHLSFFLLTPTKQGQGRQRSDKREEKRKAKRSQWGDMHVMHQQSCSEDHIWAVPFIEVKTVIKCNQVILHQLDISDINNVPWSNITWHPSDPEKSQIFSLAQHLNARNQKKANCHFEP